MQIYWIKNLGTGKIGIIPRPRGNDWLEDEIVSLKELQVTVVVSLLQDSEVKELGLEDEEKLCKKHSIKYFSFPIPDRSVPESTHKTIKFAQELLKLSLESNSVVVHCRQSVGRSSIIVVGILALTGIPTDKAFIEVSLARGCNVPDTTEQQDWVNKAFDLNH